MSDRRARPVRLALAALALVVVAALGVSASAFGRSDAAKCGSVTMFCIDIHNAEEWSPVGYLVIPIRAASHIMNERFPVTVAVVGARPIFDPENARIRS